MMEAFNRYFVGTIQERYADFHGKATRSEFWYYVLFYVIIGMLLAMVDQYLLNPSIGILESLDNKGGLLQFAFALALFVPSIAVGIRRLHDTGKSGWWTLLAFIPLLGGLVLLYFYVQESR